MRKFIPAISLIIFLTTGAYALERMIFMGGVSRQNPGGGINLEPDYSLLGGIGLEVVRDVFVLLKFDAPAQYKGNAFPLQIDINGADSSFFFHKFTAFDIMIAGHYVLPILEKSPIQPKIFGGLGLYWLFNSKKSNEYKDVNFSGLGPEFGVGFVYKSHKKLWADLTASVKFPTYNEFRVKGHDTTAVGVDVQFLSFNLTAYYLLELP